VIAVVGVPRSGTSLMMQMFVAAFGQAQVHGYMWPLIMRDGCMKWNPNGFWESGRTRYGFREHPRGKVVAKLLPIGLLRTSDGILNGIVHMNRDEDAIQRSVKATGIGNEIAMQKMIWDQWLETHPGFQVLEMQYEAVLASPRDACAQLQDFVGAGDWKDAESVPDPSLNTCGAPVDES